MSRKTGLASVYIRHSRGFHGSLRPAYDSAADSKAEMTEAEVSTLRSMINRYMAKCALRRSRERILA